MVEVYLVEGKRYRSLDRQVANFVENKVDGRGFM
jgi:hypothetical protein